MIEYGTRKTALTSPHSPISSNFSPTVAGLTGRQHCRSAAHWTSPWQKLVRQAIGSRSKFFCDTCNILPRAVRPKAEPEHRSLANLQHVPDIKVTVGATKLCPSAVRPTAVYTDLKYDSRTVMRLGSLHVERLDSTECSKITLLQRSTDGSGSGDGRAAVATG